MDKNLTGQGKANTNKVFTTTKLHTVHTYHLQYMNQPINLQIDLKKLANRTTKKVLFFNF